MPGPDDIIYDASVRDNTGKFFADFHKHLEQSEKFAKGAFAGIENAIGRMSTKAGVIGGAVAGVVAPFTNFAIEKIDQMLDKLQNFAEESAQLRARADTLGVSLKMIGQNAGYSESKLASIEDGMRKTGITILATRESMAQWIQANLDLGKAAQVARVAQDAAVIAGVNSSEAFQRITSAATTLQPEMLRSLGLIVNMEQATKKYAKENNKTTGSITAQEKQQIMLNAALEAGKTVAGAYEAAMTTVGKKQKSLERVSEDLRIAFGGIFQPIMAKNIDATTETLKKLEKYIQDNQEELIALGTSAAEVFGKVLETLLALSEFIVELPGQIKDASMAVAQFINGMDDSELEKRAANIGTYFRQAATFVLATLGFLWDNFKNTVDAALTLTKAAKDFASGDITQLQLDAIKLATAPQRSMEMMEKSIHDNFLAAAEFTGALGDADRKFKDLSKDDLIIKKLGADISLMADAFEKANDSLAKFYYSLQQDEMERQIQDTRQQIEDALQESWRLEDNARKHAEAVENIMQGAQESQQEAAKSHNEALLDIEKNYRRQLRDIQRNFEFEASELARARDAIGLLRLKRNTQRQLQEAKTQRDDSKKDADAAYKKQQQEIDTRRQEELKKLAEQEAKEEEEYQRGLKRQEELQKLHDQWEKEDRDRRNAQRLADLLKNFTEMQNVTDDGLKALLDKWSVYFGDLLTMAQQNYADMQNYTDPTSSTAVAPANAGSGTKTGTRSGSTVPHGQFGQISHMLASPAMLSPSMISVGTSMKGSSSGRKEIDVNVHGDAMDPYIQRQLAMMLMEVERNRS